MNGDKKEVRFPYMYSLKYKVGHEGLPCSEYVLDFMDWVEAGLAFSIYSDKNPRRKASYFGNLRRKVLAGEVEQNVELFRESLTFFYEDLFDIYQDHLLSQLAKESHHVNKNLKSEPSDLLIVPSFFRTPELLEVIPKEEVVLDSYETCFYREFQHALATIYVSSGTQLYRTMSVYFDYGVKRKKGGVLLEVRCNND